MSDPAKTRAIAVRLIVTGHLELVTPAQLGNGDAESITAMPLLLDPVSQRPLLTGTSIAGALRGYLHSYERGYGARSDNKLDAAMLATQLFGSSKGDDQGEQSPLIVEDALGTLPPQRGFEIRDGVKIDYATHTADDKKKYDLELLPAGTTFSLRFELLLPADPTQALRLRQALALTLQGLAADAHGYGAITLGARRSRGFGRCRVRDQWQFRRYTLLRDPEGLLAWLAANHEGWMPPPPPTEVWTGNAAAVLGAAEAMPTDLCHDARRSFQIEAGFDLVGAILVRSSDPLTSAGAQPDVAHLHAYHPATPDQKTPILPGTSLAGALRGRATHIINTLWWPPSARSEALLDHMFGRDMHRKPREGEPAQPTASRLIVEESPLRNGTPLVQNRIAIDRFTGGAYDTALFAEGPYVGGDVVLWLTLRLDETPDLAQQQAEIGLLLLLLKDLWTGDLPLGGTSSIGRGRLSGRWAKLIADNGTAWQLDASGAKLEVRRTNGVDERAPSGETKPLESYVKALYTYLRA